METQKYKFLFVGPSKSGKSTLVNMLCNYDYNKFDNPAPIGDGVSSTTKNFFCYHSTIKNYIIIDSVGFFDQLNENNDKILFESIKKIITELYNGINVIFFVLKMENPTRLSSLVNDFINWYCKIYSLKDNDKLKMRNCCCIITHTEAFLSRYNENSDEFLESRSNIENEFTLMERLKKFEKIIFVNNKRSDEDNDEQHCINLRKKSWDYIEKYINIKIIENTILKSNLSYDSFLLKILKWFGYNNDKKINKKILNVNYKFIEDYGKCSYCKKNTTDENSKKTKCNHYIHNTCFLEIQTKKVCVFCIHCNKELVL